MRRSFAIRLRCPHCRKMTVAKRQPEDPDRAYVAEILCPECVEETSAHEPPTYYFDTKGKELPPDEVAVHMERSTPKGGGE